MQVVSEMEKIWNLPEEGQKVTHQVCEGCVGKLLQAQNQEAKHKKIQPRSKKIKSLQCKELLASESKRVFLHRSLHVEASQTGSSGFQGPAPPAGCQGDVRVAAINIHHMC